MSKTLKKQLVIAPLLPLKSTPSPLISMNVQLLTSPETKSPSNASDLIFEKFESCNLNFDETIFRASSDVIFLNMQLSKDTKELYALIPPVKDQPLKTFPFGFETVPIPLMLEKTT